MARKSRTQSREIRKQRTRQSVRGTESKPRLCIYKSLKYTYAQLVVDDGGRVVASASTREAEGKKSKATVDQAKELGKRIAELAKAKSIKQVVFDRNGYAFHGRVAAVAAGAREAGLTL